MYNESITEFKRALSMFPNNTNGLSDLGWAYAMTGRKAEAQNVLDHLSALSKHEYVAPKNVAIIYAALGEKDKAFDLLEQAYENRSLASGQGIKAFPGFDPLRSDPRFADLLRRINLQP